RRIAERARTVDVGAADLAAERRRAAQLLAGTRYSGFAAMTALREATSREAVAAAAAQLGAVAGGDAAVGIAAVAGAWWPGADAGLAAADAAPAGELYARASALTDTVALQVRCAWVAATAGVAPGVTPAAVTAALHAATPLVERAVAGDVAPAL